MIERYRVNVPVPHWFAVGPVYVCRGEWRRMSGVAVSIGQHGVAVNWARRRR